MRFRVLACALLTVLIARADDLKISVYATAGGIEKYLRDDDGRRKATAKLKRLGITRIILEGRRGDEYVDPIAMRVVRDALSDMGFETAGGIATVPGRQFGVRQQGGLSWLNFEAEKTRGDVAAFFAENAPLFDDLIVDDFYCTADTSPESERARGARSWSEYRRQLLVSLIRPMMIAPARRANPRVRLTLKYPQWYDRFHLFGYDPPRMSPQFDRIWVGTEVRNPETRRMGFAQPTMGYINFRWLASISGWQVEGAWFDHIECTARNFVDQAWQSVLAGARELTLFSLIDVVEDHPGHDLFAAALPELQALAKAISGKPVRGVAFYKPPGSDGDGDIYLMDYLAMMGVPVVPVSQYPFDSRVVVLGSQAGGDAGIRDKIARHRRRGAKVFATRAFAAKVPGDWDRLDVSTFTEQDFRDTGEWLLPPKRLSIIDASAAGADRFRAPLLAPLGLRLSAPARVALYDFAGRRVAFNFHDAPVEIRLNGRRALVPANSLLWLSGR